MRILFDGERVTGDATSEEFELPSGSRAIAINGTIGGATVTLQFRIAGSPASFDPPDWDPVPDASFTETGLHALTIPERYIEAKNAGQLRFTIDVAGGAGVDLLIGI